MVSWTYAFRRGAIIWLWSILWGIIGGVIALIISGGSIIILITNPTSTTLEAGAIIGIFVGVIIGALVASIGGLAATVKIVLESAQELESKRQPAQA